VLESGRITGTGVSGEESLDKVRAAMAV
jgi:hypothetical protein